MGDPRVAFCVTCKGRVEHLKVTLPKNLTDNADYHNAVFVVLDYNSPDDLREYLHATFAAELLRARLVLYSYPQAANFRMAHAKNMAHRCAMLEGADILVNLDADNFTGAGFARYIAQEFAQAKERIFMWARVHGAYAVGINGRLIATAKDFLCVGGYDERFETWGPDDRDFNRRLTLLGVKPTEIDHKYLDGIHHSDAQRFEAYPQIKDSWWKQHHQEENHHYDSAVVNGGSIGCGEVVRNSHEAVTIAPLPVRVFGIGMHKTGTESLHRAMQILGFDSAHWESAQWARLIWMEVKAFGRSDALEQHYALSDLPITLLYKELDAAYPGSKFVLTVRSESAWLVSVERHWDAEFNRLRFEWGTDRFTHYIHTQLYGQATFDAKVFLDRYRSHNAAVQEYFRDRPQDLLVLDIDEPDTIWPRLALFLGKPVPNEPYPWLGATRRT